MTLSQQDVRALVQRMMDETGLTPTALARRAGVVPSTVTRFMSGGAKHTLGLRSLAKLSAASGIPVPMGAAGLAPGSVPEDANKPPPLLPQRHEMPRDVPVFGTAMGANGDGAFTINLGGQVDMVRRGPGIASNRGVFAIYVEGESMAPRFQPGELVYLDKNRPIRTGDDVVLVVEMPGKGDEPRAYLKRLVRRTADRWICEQFNPPKDVEFQVTALKDKFRVLTLNEVMGA